MSMGVCPSKWPPEWLEEYCIQDVETEYEVFLKQRAVLVAANQLPLVYTRCLLTPVLADIEFNGMQLDKERVDILYGKYRTEYDEVCRELNEITGGINWNSPKQLAEFIYDELGFDEPCDHYGNKIRTATGQRTTSQDDLGTLRAKTKAQKRFLAVYAKANKVETALTKYIAKFKECCETDDGILFGKFNQSITVTHRLSSTGGVLYKVQFQNMDRNFKPLFRARRPEWRLHEADQAGLEYRVAIWFGNDTLGRHRLSTKFDIHRHTANIMSEAGQPPCGKHKEKDVTCKDCRQEAKEFTFKPTYGGSSGTPAEQEYYTAFKKEHAGISATQHSWAMEVLKTKQLTLCTGFTAYWPDTKMTRSGYITNSTKIYNLPIQYLATAEIVPIGIIYVWHLLKANSMLSFMVNTVHDSCISEVHPDEVDMMNEVCQEGMVNRVLPYLKRVYNISFDVPLELEQKALEYWNDSDKWKEQYLN
jgi:DNA polymerase I-like protein with 3'-5' exonuclease and polymerase domains